MTGATFQKSGKVMGEYNGVKPGTFMASRDRYKQHKNKHAIIKTCFLKKTTILTLVSPQ